jgi:translation initiation factor IF-3
VPTAILEEAVATLLRLRWREPEHSWQHARPDNVQPQEDIIRNQRYARVPRDRGPRKNEEIKLSPLRVIGADNKQIGVIEREEALRLAEEAGLDLIEIEATARPPVCKIMDYGKFKYEKSKRARAAVDPKKAAETKEIRLGRSVKIEEHDLRVRMEQARRFLLSGHRVRIIQRFRGREMVHTDIGFNQLSRVAEELGTFGKIVVPPKLMGRQIAMELVPDRSKMAAATAKEHKGAPMSDRDALGAELLEQVEALDRADALDVDEADEMDEAAEAGETDVAEAGETDVDEDKAPEGE